VQYKTSFVLAHKIREAMASEVHHIAVGGQGKRAEVDGGYFGGYVKRANLRENRRDRRLRQSQSGKRKVVVVIRERGPEGKTLPGVFRNEADAPTFIGRQVPIGTELYANEAASWNELHARYELHRINHQEAYSLGDDAETNTNNGESFFSEPIYKILVLKGTVERNPPPQAGERQGAALAVARIDRLPALWVRLLRQHGPAVTVAWRRTLLLSLYWNRRMPV
jgi:hypothetical protein